ncbi:amino acid adenylation domain-containing protein [Actinophytocola sp.]|uniref:amino acid adenylation domain-containing protein n=1 Tax=Actinophytocola sp. TaxID=1872138 RepID=UPI003D6AC58F
MSGLSARTLRIDGPLDPAAFLGHLGGRARLSRCGPGRHLLHVEAADHRAFAVLLDDLLAQFRGTEPNPAPTDAVPGSAEDAWAYWRERLAGPLGVLELASGPRDAAAAGPAVAVPLADTPDTVTLLAAIEVLLRRYWGVTDVLLGLPVAPANTVVLREDLGGDLSVAELMARTARSLRAALEHRALPLDELMRRSGATTPPFQVAVTIDTLLLPGFGEAAVDFALGQTGPVVTAGDVRVQPVANVERALPAPLTIVAALDRERPSVSIVADPALFPGEFQAGLADDLATVIGGMATAGPVSRLLPRPAPETCGMPDPAQAHATDPDFTPFELADLDGSIIDRFLRQADRHGDRPAVLSAGGSVTYRELATRAGAIAAALHEAGARQGARVALLLDHGVETIAAIFGVLWTGAAYVPLDPSYPVERLGYMLGHAEACAAVTTGAHRALLDDLSAAGPAPHVVDLGDLRPGAPPANAATADGPAYILYTSGSTGLPKGVVQTHRNVLFQVRNHTNNLRVAPRDRLSLLSSFSFDMAVTDLFSALLNGAAVVPLDLRGGGLTGMAATLNALGVSVYHSTPTVYRHLLGGLADGETLGRVRAVLLGGEPVTWEDVERSRAHLPAGAVLVNGYGTTEVSFAAQYHLPLASATSATPVTPVTSTTARAGVVPIGHPLDGIEIVLLAPDGRPAALYGEIGIRSRYVAVGYWRDPDLNERKFRADTRTDGAATRTYLTGDLGRRLPDGTLAYLGRGDRQIKIRGYRVELGEIEAVLHAEPAVGQAVAAARETAKGTELVAYVESEGADPAALRSRLAEALPHFMVPRTVVVLAALPLTPTGKVDVRALPAPGPVRVRSSTPEGPVESAIADVWCQVLGVAAVGREDDFFEMGGSSLQLAQAQERLAARLGSRIPLTAMLEHPTVAALAGFADGGTKAAAPLDAMRDRAARRRKARTRRGADE